MIGWTVAWKCLVACLFLDESQQPTCPHSRQRRRWTHVSPILKQSSQPFALGVTSRIWSRWVHCIAKSVSFLIVYDAFLSLGGFFPSMSKSELRELHTANAAAINITTRKLLIKDSAIACCTAA